MSVVYYRVILSGYECWILGNEYWISNAQTCSIAIQPLKQEKAIIALQMLTDLIPLEHPFRVIDNMLHDGPDGSIIRVYAYLITDLNALDMFAHYGKRRKSTLSFIRVK